MKTGVHMISAIPLPLCKKVALKDKTQAAIASPYAAEYFGLSVLKEGIFSNPENSTRFYYCHEK